MFVDLSPLPFPMPLILSPRFVLRRLLRLSNCSVFSCSKMENQVINQAYFGAGGDVVDIREPVLALVFPSLSNWYHVVVETAPRLLVALAELEHGTQYPFLAKPPYGPKTKILTVDTPAMRKLLTAVGLLGDKKHGGGDGGDRIIWATAGVGRRYRLHDAVLVDYGFDRGGTREKEGKKERKSKKTKAKTGGGKRLRRVSFDVAVSDRHNTTMAVDALKQMDPLKEGAGEGRTQGGGNGEESNEARSEHELRWNDPWDGISSPGVDLRSYYRPPRVALRLVRDSLGTHGGTRVGFDRGGGAAAADLPTQPPVPTLSRVVYVSRSGASSRFVIGERALLRRLSLALAAVGGELVVHYGNGTADVVEARKSEKKRRGRGRDSRESRRRSGSARSAPTTTTFDVRSLTSQADLYGGARIVVGPHGAGLTNMIWMRPGGAVVRFPIIPDVEACFQYMAGALDLRYFETPEMSCAGMNGKYGAAVAAGVAGVGEEGKGRGMSSAAVRRRVVRTVMEAWRSAGGGRGKMEVERDMGAGMGGGGESGEGDGGGSSGGDRSAVRISHGDEL